ncbi:YbaB/EbfC family nucleoid-associated protein [Streptomyces sp. NPDC048629]|uniref:YbaB/EbfC family nucleoid-associated protein n=1 Tax=Streptomyces sp. NPDC048629 TaxID=3154824 RepID=UPI00342D951F
MLDPANEARLQEILGSFEKTRDSVLAMQKKMQEASQTYRSPDKVMSVTVDARGQLTDVTFHNTKYKQMSAKELGKLVLQTVSQAHLALQSESLAALQPVLDLGSDAADAPGGVNPWELLPGGLGGANGDLMQMIKGGMEEAMKSLTAGLPMPPAAAAGPKPTGSRSTPASGSRPAGSLDDDEA